VAFEVSGKLDSWSWMTLFFFLISVVGSYVGQIWSLEELVLLTGDQFIAAYDISSFFVTVLQLAAYFPGGTPSVDLKQRLRWL
jgi:hypothetical protein